MNHKNLFLFDGIVCLLFGIPLLISPDMIVGMYAVDISTLDVYGTHMARDAGIVLTSVGIALLAATKARESYGRRALLIQIVVSSILLLALHVYAITAGYLNTLTWSIVALTLFLTIWSGKLLMAEKVGEAD